MAVSCRRWSQVGPPVVARKIVGGDCYEASSIGSRVWGCVFLACHERGKPRDSTWDVWQVFSCVSTFVVFLLVFVFSLFSLCIFKDSCVSALFEKACPSVAQFRAKRMCISGVGLQLFCQSKTASAWCVFLEDFLLICNLPGSTVLLYAKFIWLSISWTWRIQADRSEWAKLSAEAQKNDRRWLQEQLERRHLKTLLQFIASAELRLGRHPSKGVCVAALVEHQFPLASRCGKGVYMFACHFLVR